MKETDPMLKRSFIGLAAAMVLSASPALAHHAFSADFDRDKPITLDGTVTKVEWTNPHAYLYLDAKDETGKTGNWKIELGSRDQLRKDGWNQTSLKVGQHVNMQGWRAKNGSMFANADSITMDTGDKLSAASSYYSTPGATGATGALARNDANRPNASGTSGNDLPRTASPLPFIGLLGALASLSAFALNRARA